MDLTDLALPALAIVAVAGLLFAVLDPLLSGQNKARKRRAALKSRGPSLAASRSNDAARRRKQVADSLKEIDSRSKSKKLTFETRLAQAGLDWSKSKYAVISVILGCIMGSVGYFIQGNPLIAGGLAIVGGLGLPHWFVNYCRKRRVKKFLEVFPQAIDIIVRGIKAGIPLGDCFRNIAMEGEEPVKTEFRYIVDTQSLGLTIPEAVDRIVERVPTPEASFFSIVITIQAKAGGNLAEALGNLSNVLRDRKKMKGKIKAMSAEAKASAGIIGALPFLVAFFVYLTSPAYISLLFTTSTGNMVLGCCAFWMGCGIFVMNKMINFDM
ncbi:MAG: type II secretion system F family protein [Beijerinckiaceae bacterium]|nr:type II secretion system F family protein [Beijerinckiaceae bacterium]